MTEETRDFIIGLFEAYAESSDGKEPANALALAKAWDEISL